MVRISEFVLSFIVNSIWQIPAIFAIAAAGTFLLKDGSARHRHILWIAALVLSIAAPLLSASQLIPDSLPKFQVTATDVSLQPVVKPSVQLSTNSDELRPVASRTLNRSVVSTTTNKALVLTFVYALFISCCLIRFARLWYRKESLLRSVSLTDLPQQLEQIAARCRSAFQLTQVAIGRSAMARVPCTLGSRRPLIVVPDSFCVGMNDETVISVIGHEMAHVARRDFLTKLICEALSLPISFHPITFLIKQRIERERELACDELVTELVLPRQVYARSLVAAADASILPAQSSFMLSVFDGRMLEERIMKLTNQQFSLGTVAGRAIMITTLFVLGVCALSLSAFAVELRTQARNVLEQSVPTTFADPPPPVFANSQTAVQDKLPTPVQIQSQMKSPSAQERAQAACAAGRKQDTSSMDTLIAMLADDSKTELLRCWDSGNWNPALETFKHPSPGEQAAIALASMGRSAFPALANQLNSSNATVRRNAAWAIGELTNTSHSERASAGPQLSALLSDSDEWVRMAAARALGEIRYRAGNDNLIATLLDADWRVREMAAWALSEMKEKRAVQALCNVLTSDPRAEVRRGAAEALGEIRSPEALPSLKQALNDPETRVSAKAGWAINEIEDSDGL